MTSIILSPPSRFLRKYFCVGKQRNVPLLPPSVYKRQIQIAVSVILNNFKFTFVQIAFAVPTLIYLYLLYVISYLCICYLLLL